MAVTIIMVYKSGGDFTVRDVEKLHNNIVEKFTLPYDIVCFTDVPEEFHWPINCIKLKREFKVTNVYKGWWAKLEIFQLMGKCIYFDLDTILVANCDWMFDLVKHIGSFYMLEDFYRKTPASGVMAWHGDFSILNKNPLYNPQSWDQHYIIRRLQHYKIQLIQQEHSGVYSYKVHIRNQAIPCDTKIICFHGKPRPKDVNYLKDELNELLLKQQSRVSL